MRITRSSTAVDIPAWEAQQGRGTPQGDVGCHHRWGVAERHHHDPDGAEPLDQRTGRDARGKGHRTGRDSQLAPGGPDSSQDWKPINDDELIAISTSPCAVEQRTTT